MCLRDRPRSLRPGPGGPEDLGEDLQPFAALAVERAAEHGLGPGAGVDVGGVEGGDPEVERGSHARGGGVLLDLGAVGDPVAVRDLADEHAGSAEVTKFHAREPMAGCAFRDRRARRARSYSIGRVSASSCSSSFATGLPAGVRRRDQRLTVAADRTPSMVRVGEQERHRMDHHRRIRQRDDDPAGTVDHALAPADLDDRQASSVKPSTYRPSASPGGERRRRRTAPASRPLVLDRTPLAAAGARSRSRAGMAARRRSWTG